MGCAITTDATTTTQEEVLPSSKRERVSAPQLSVGDGRGSFHDKYLVSSKLGKGAFASVHLAHKIGSTEKYAVKVTDLRGQKNGGPFDGPVDAKRRQVTVKEVKMLQAVDGKEHVIALIDAFTEGTLSYVVLERCDHSLLQVLDRIPDLTECSIQRILCEMLKGIAASHSVGCVHRDIKPDNFMCVGQNATVKLCDFGLAAMLPPSRDLGLAGIYGTPPFMAPEMLGGKLYGHKVDTWSFGVIAYILFFGHFPYTPAEQTGPAMKAAILVGNHPPTFSPKPGLEVSSNTARISPGAVAMVKKLLCRVPEDRPTAQEALRCSFFQMVPNPSRQSATLRPMLFAAKRIGAFDVRASKPQTTDVDLRLAALQEERYSAGIVQENLALEGKANDHEGKSQSRSGSPQLHSSFSKRRPSETSTDAGSVLPSWGTGTTGTTGTGSTIVTVRRGS